MAVPADFGNSDPVEQGGRAAEAVSSQLEQLARHNQTSVSRRARNTRCPARCSGGDARCVLRYAHEPRRRNQLLMVRKVTTWVLVAIIVGLTFVTELSSFATFAGLLTAGVAVAMQSVLVSSVGYFFLIGKYGIRVGDRVQIGNVSGEVIDLGLVRMHLMELSSQGPLGPTGRVVAFANLIVFQASGGLFKQIPGVNLSWRETTLTLPVVSDYAALKDKLLAAVNGAVGEYQEEIVRQTKE